MDELITFLENNKVGFLATVQDGQARVRPFGFQFYEENKFYFITSKQKDTYKQLSEHIQAEFSCISPQYATARINGRVEFSDDKKKIKTILENSPTVKNKYKTADNPDLAMFYIYQGEAVLFDFAQENVKKFNF